MAQSSEPRQDLTIIRNFIDHSHHNLASFFLNILIGGLVRGLTCYFPLGSPVLIHSTEPTRQQRNIPQYPMEFIKPAINLLHNTGCKENRFYSLSFGQAEASIY